MNHIGFRQNYLSFTIEAFAAQGNSFAMYFLSEYYKKKGNIELGNEWREKARAAHNLLV